MEAVTKMVSNFLPTVIAYFDKCLPNLQYTSMTAQIVWMDVTTKNQNIQVAQKVVDVGCSCNLTLFFHVILPLFVLERKQNNFLSILKSSWLIFPIILEGVQDPMYRLSPRTCFRQKKMSSNMFPLFENV